MSRPERRYLIRIGRRSGDPDTAMRFLAVARLTAGRSTVEVANGLEIARSTVVRAAAKFEVLGVDGLFDQRTSPSILSFKVDSQATAERYKTAFTHAAALCRASRPREAF